MQKQVTINSEDMEAFEKFQKEQEVKRAEAKKRENREAYAALVDELINESMPKLRKLSADLAAVKAEIRMSFRTIMTMKVGLYGDKVSSQYSHTFTNSDVDKRITIGQYIIDNYRDTAEDGIQMVMEYLESLVKDDQTEALIKVVKRLMSRDAKGTLKASKVLQLSKMAEESGDAKFIEGVKIIRDAYQPVVSKEFIRAEEKNEKGEWKSIALGMTEA